jgi:hypothetical protein
MTSILKADNIQDADGNNIINESSNTITIGASGDTISIPSGATFNINGTAGTGIGTNTPAFSAYLNADQTITDNTWTKIQIDTEVFDSDGTYDNSSNYRFTPAVAGKYIISSQIRVVGGSDNQLRKVNFAIYKNGSFRQKFIINTQDSYSLHTSSAICNLTDTASATDYYEVYCQADVGSGTVAADGDNLGTWFAAHKIIGA